MIYIIDKILLGIIGQPIFVSIYEYIYHNQYKKTMKKLFLLFLLLASFVGFTQETISPYYCLGEVSENIETLIPTVKDTLTATGFNVIGEYHPEKNENLYVIAYTSDELINLTQKFADRGLLAATLKVGFVSKEGKTTISMLNPEYQFRAYIYEGYDNYASKFEALSQSAIDVLKPLGNKFEAFGGEEKKDKLYKYHYKMMMPYFTDPVELNEFSSFAEGLKTIRENLEAGLGNTAKVYEIVDEEMQIAVFGVALYDADEGEGDFLPVIGEDHIAAMPYDIILQGNTATMLHGKYRFALLWPELTMGTFMKIMSTPKNVERFMEALTK